MQGAASSLAGQTRHVGERRRSLTEGLLGAIVAVWLRFLLSARSYRSYKAFFGKETRLRLDERLRDTVFRCSVSTSGTKVRQPTSVEHRFEIRVIAM